MERRRWAAAKAVVEPFRTAVSVVASVSMMDCLDPDRGTAPPPSRALPRTVELTDERRDGRETTAGGLVRLLREWMDAELVSGCFGEDEGKCCTGIFTMVESGAAGERISVET